MRVGAQEHGLFLAARVQQPVGEDMAALGIGAELDLVDDEEGDARISSGIASTVQTIIARRLAERSSPRR